MNLRQNKVLVMIQEADRSMCIVHSNHNVRCFTKLEIEKLTDDFSKMIGRGAFGEVFLGILEDTSMVAVKRFVHDVKGTDFTKELTVHSEINHKNVVKLMGYCVDENALMIVTKYISNGNLSDDLHQQSTPIPLDIRLKIATECAEALAYMHSHMYTQVIHGDIKPDNILLDDSFNAKISDFGISRLVNTDTKLYTETVIGSKGYMDPLFARDGRLTVKSDVYSFGVVLLELITRKKATTKVGQCSFIEQCTGALSRGIRGVREMLDVEITGQNNMKTLEGIAKLARECLRMERDGRPEMIDVVVRLRMLAKALRQRQERVDLFFWARKSKPSAPALVTIPADPFAPLFRRFSRGEMLAATNNFDKSLRLGESGKVYRGTIDGTTVAIKYLGYANGDRRHRLLANINMSLKLHHRHLVPLIGYCDKGDRFILVYKYMSRGSLQEHLSELQNNPPLPWTRCLEICIGAAHGLHHLHTGAELPMIQCTVKLTHILLDEDWVAKVSHNIESDPAGSKGPYCLGNTCDPECDEGPRSLTEKSYVFSFGGVLLEVLHGISYPTMDPHLNGEDINLKSLRNFIETTQKCRICFGDERPTMKDVVSDLESALQLQKAEMSEGNHVIRRPTMGDGVQVP